MSIFFDRGFLDALEKLGADAERKRQGMNTKTSADLAGEALYGTPKGYQYLDGLLKQAVARRKMAADEPMVLEEQRKQQNVLLFSY